MVKSLGQRQGTNIYACTKRISNIFELSIDAINSQRKEKEEDTPATRSIVNNDCK